MAGPNWDTMYDVEGYRYGEAPNAFLEEVAGAGDGRRALCIGDGEGRNGVWLAGQGWATVSVEPSTVGCRKITALAEARGVSVDVRHGGVPDVEIEARAYDLVVLCYVHAPPPVRAQIHEAACAALAPGGRIVLEAFSPEQLGYNSGGPPVEAMLFTADMLRADFAQPGITISALDALEVELDEGPGHSGPGRVVRMVATRAG